MDLFLLNGGFNASKFELFRSYYEHINQSSVINKICYFIILPKPHFINMKSL